VAQTPDHRRAPRREPRCRDTTEVHPTNEQLWRFAPEQRKPFPNPNDLAVTLDFAAQRAATTQRDDHIRHAASRSCLAQASEIRFGTTTIERIDDMHNLQVIRHDA
jgi:hypothetical protein